jgi:hypothetical protein
MKYKVKKGVFFETPSPGEEYGIQNLIALAVLAGKAGKLTKETAADGRIDLFEAFRVFRFIREVIPAASALDFAAIKNEIRDLTPEEAATLAAGISEAVGTSETVSDLLGPFLEAVAGISGFVEAAKKLNG